MTKATFAAGCFWGIEEAFANKDGVTNTSVGYSGGNTKNPTYEDVCRGDTGHAEVVEVDFDPEKVSYEDLVAFFWRIHDPTQVNRQGPDIGTQYRSAIFAHDDAQTEAASASKASLEASGSLPQAVATEISPAATYYPAEEYHQKYFQKIGLANRLFHT